MVCARGAATLIPTARTGGDPQHPELRRMYGGGPTPSFLQTNAGTAGGTNFRQTRRTIPLPEASMESCPLTGRGHDSGGSNGNFENAEASQRKWERRYPGFSKNNLRGIFVGKQVVSKRAARPALSPPSSSRIRFLRQGICGRGHRTHTFSPLPRYRGQGWRIRARSVVAKD